AAIGWLLRIARHLVIDTYRQRQRRGHDENLDGFEICSPERGPEDEALAREQWDKLWQLIETLPEQQREMVVLRYSLGWRINRIAAHLDLTENYVSVTLRRTIDRLANMNGEEAV